LIKIVKFGGIAYRIFWLRELFALAIKQIIR